MTSFLQRLRTLLVLGRVSNLPTVWSNLLVGWTLADGPRGGLMRVDYHGPDAAFGPIALVLLGGSFLYIGGMYLNDYCDVAFDTRYCPTRPIPDGKISRRIVGLMAALWFTAGIACFSSFGPVTIATALLLVVAIVTYDFHHKNVVWAPLIIAACRCLLYLLAASSLGEFDYFNRSDVDGWLPHALDYFRGGDFWFRVQEASRYLLPALPLGLYVAGLTYLARGESRSGKPTRWPNLLLMLALLLLIGFYGFWIQHHDWLRIQNPHEYLLMLIHCLVPFLFLVGWMAWILVPFWRKTKPSVGRVISGLLAGIVLLDMVVIVHQVGPYAVGLLPLFILALLLQRFIPAT